MPGKAYCKTLMVSRIPTRRFEHKYKSISYQRWQSPCYDANILKASHVISHNNRKLSKLQKAEFKICPRICLCLTSKYLKVHFGFAIQDYRHRERQHPPWGKEQEQKPWVNLLFDDTLTWPVCSLTIQQSELHEHEINFQINNEKENKKTWSH